MRALTVGVFVCIVASACSSSSSGTTSSSSGGGDGGGGATFTQVYGVIKAQCTPCHAQLAGVSEGKLDMSAQDKAYTNLVNVPGAGTQCNGKGTRVVAGKPDQSLLYLKVTNPPCGDKMPQGLPALSKDQTDLISAWITAGAPNN
jgi:hypothetical protein